MSKKEKGLMGTDNSVVTAGLEGYKGTKRQWKKHDKIKIKAEKQREMINIEAYEACPEKFQPLLIQRTVYMT